MALQVINGKVVKAKDRLVKRGVALVLMNAATKAVQIVNHALVVGVKSNTPGRPVQYAGPTAAFWEQLRAQDPESFDGMQHVGTLIAETEGAWLGHIDWVVPLDTSNIAERRAQDVIEGRGEAPERIQTIRVPVHIDEDTPFVQRMMADPVLMAEVIKTKGGGDMIAAILRAAVRVAKEER